MLAVVIMGNPKHFTKPVHHFFYDDIKNYLTVRGFKVRFDRGLPETMPTVNADLYICHSRGCSRVKWFGPEQRKKTCVFGDPTTGGILNRNDSKCYDDDDIFICDIAPDDHFIFSDKMRKCIDNKIKSLHTNT
jgi:predicted SPOUT superfamily RNA methylase MTH1